MRTRTSIAVGMSIALTAGMAYADQSGISSYSRAREVFWKQVYKDGGEELYCGTRFDTRLPSMNIEHAFPAKWMVDFLGCGSRAKCRSQSARFNRMEGDLHNLFPSDSALNNTRQNYPFAEIPGENLVRPGCDFEIAGNGENKVVEPRPEVRGDLARAILYMQAEYGVPADPGFRDQLVAWSKADPPSPAEIARNRRIEGIQGNRNQFIPDEAPDPLSVTFSAPGTSLSELGAGLKVVTWNMGWLTDRAEEINKAPQTSSKKSKIYQRKPADFTLLRSYADALAADIVAVQEVDGIETLKKVFDPNTYHLILTDEDDYQRPGFAIRKTLQVTNNGDLAELDVIPNEKRSLRRGADVTVDAAGTRIRLLSVHLKSGCFSAIDCKSKDARQQQAKQIPILSRWIDARQKENLPFAVLGDFNRRFSTSDQHWKAIDNGPVPLARPTEGEVNTCWNNPEHAEFIDHILIDGRFADRLVEGSLKVHEYKERGEKYTRILSDHCPVSVLLSGLR